ncbi:MAG: hypothetical protein PUE65_03770 [Mollicutes bacterium]|nr:hypothetical protein [Mollicutes bacterium]
MPRIETTSPIVISNLALSVSSTDGSIIRKGSNYVLASDGSNTLERAMGFCFGSREANVPHSLSLKFSGGTSLTPNSGGKIGLGETGVTAAGLSLSTVFVCVDDSLSDCSSCVCVPIGFWALPTVPKNMDVAMTNAFSPNCFI